MGAGSQAKSGFVGSAVIILAGVLLGAAATAAPLGRSDPVSTDYNHILERRHP